ncbi:MAG: hypothetical protein JO103_13780 [Candidatus Eremiobacteraeota bacterium]|nr:hypothetical protein [Candidatus Eremiobacteraeota bacterium]
MGAWIDHVDLRVPALGVVEAFYDAFFERLGLTRKGYARVARGGALWEDGTPEDYNAVEYYEENVTGRPAHFFGVIEEVEVQPAAGRIAFAVVAETLAEWATVLPQIGAREIEHNDDDGYPALFFTDPLGTRLELCARRLRT